MGYAKLILEVFLAIPSLMRAFDEIKRQRKLREEQAHRDAMSKLKGAEDEEAIKQATRDRAAHP